MHPIIYDVAVSLDGFISGPSGDISKFAHDGPVVDDYRARLDGYATVIMGRATYEFGYDFGLQPGQNPYPGCRTIVFSQALACPRDADITITRATDGAVIRDLKQTSDGPIYLCGGGAFAGWLLDRDLIDRIILKRAPILYGSGVRLFGAATVPRSVKRVATKPYDNGYVLEDFAV